MKTEDDVTIYPPDPGNAEYDIAVGGKHLTGPEIMAEYWYFDLADFDWPGDPDDLTDEQWETWRKRHGEARASLDRFASLPHASETNYD